MGLNLESVIVSKFRTRTIQTNEPVSVYDELMRIKGGAYSESISACRSALEAGDEERYKQLKTQLEGITFSARYGNSRRLDSLIEYNGIITIDVDKLPQDRLIQVRDSLVKDPYIMSTWYSPSNKGLKALVTTDSNMHTHKAYFNYLLDHFKTKYNIDIDRSGSDIGRLCFVSWDSDLYFNPNSECLRLGTDQLELDYSISLTKVNPKENDKTEAKAKALISTERSILYRTEGKNKPLDRKTIKHIIKYLEKLNASITSDYEQWYRTAFAIANTFSFDVGEGYFLSLCRLDGTKHDEYKSTELLKYAYLNRRENTINLATIVHLAAKHGYILQKRSGHYALA